jgi:hypothetical protein
MKKVENPILFGLQLLSRTLEFFDRFALLANQGKQEDETDDK